MKQFAVAYGNPHDGVLDIKVVEADNWRGALLKTDTIFEEILDLADKDAADTFRETELDDVIDWAFDEDVMLQVKEIN